MVTFGEKHFTVKVEAPFPTDHLHGTIHEIIDVLQKEDEKTDEHRFFLLELLKHMIPEPEQICEKQRVEC